VVTEDLTCSISLWRNRSQIGITQVEADSSKVVPFPEAHFPTVSEYLLPSDETRSGWRVIYIAYIFYLLATLLTPSFLSCPMTYTTRLP